MIDSGVKTQHPDYKKRIDQWTIMRDVLEGSDAIKAKGDAYLPRQTSAHKAFDRYEELQYEAYKGRASFVNYTAQIKDCLHGMIENRPAKIEIPAEMRATGILDNIDYQGNSADQFFSDCLDDVLATGRGGILAELPDVDPNMSVAKAEKDNIRPYASYYCAESIINWKFKVINGVKKLCLVVLAEDVDLAEDMFSHETKKQYRVLALDEKNEYIQIVYQSVRKADGSEIESPISRKKVLVNGQPLNYIPFITMPYNNPVKPVLYDIALENIHHYQVSADYQNGAHLTSRPTGYFTGHTPETDKEGNVIPVYVGTDVFWQLPEADAKVGVCSFSGEGIEHLEKELNRSEAHIITLASHIIQPDKKTAENKDAITIHRAGEDAKLATIAKYMSNRFTQFLKIITEWCGYNPDDVSVELNTDFSNLSFDANAVNAIANIFTQGKLPLRCLYYLLQSGGYLEPDMTYEGFVYLLDLEASSLSPTEVDTAYRQYKKKGSKIDVPNKDWYSPEDTENKEETVTKV